MRFKIKNKFIKTIVANWLLLRNKKKYVYIYDISYDNYLLIMILNNKNILKSKVVHVF